MYFVMNHDYNYIWQSDWEESSSEKTEGDSDAMETDSGSSDNASSDSDDSDASKTDNKTARSVLRRKVLANAWDFVWARMAVPTIKQSWRKITPFVKFEWSFYIWGFAWCFLWKKA